MLYQSQLDEILRLLADGVSCRDVAEQVGVSYSTVANIRAGRRTGKTKSDAEVVIEEDGLLSFCSKCGRAFRGRCVSCDAKDKLGAVMRGKDERLALPKVLRRSKDDPPKQEIAARASAIRFLWRFMQDPNDNWEENDKGDDDGLLS